MATMLRTPWRITVLACALLTAACGSSQPLGHTIVASSHGTLTPGAQRVLALAADADQDLIGGPDLPATAVLWEGEERVADAETEWVWAIEDVRGFYAATLDLPAAGNYGLSLEMPDGSTTPAGLQVVETTPIPKIGDPAPRSESRTTADHDLEELTTDPEPEPSFYTMSVAEAVTSGRPTVIVFATPAFCQTAACGPTLDVVKAVAVGQPDINFVHVEVFENIDDTQGELIEVPAVTEWGLFTEPWAFVVDSHGIVTASFEGAVGSFEIERALADLR